MPILSSTDDASAPGRTGVDYLEVLAVAIAAFQAELVRMAGLHLLSAAKHPQPCDLQAVLHAIRKYLEVSYPSTPLF